MTSSGRPYGWTGSIRRGEAPGIIVGEMRDTFNYTIAITGRIVAGGYEIVGTPGPIPEEWRIPLLDDDLEKEQ